MMRAPCRWGCDTSEGYIVTANGQDVVRCARCNRACYNAPKIETGRAPRTVSSVHSTLSPSKRARIITLDGGRCALCGVRGGEEDGLHVGHLLPVVSGLAAGLTEVELNSDENLAAMCAECNLGLADNPVPLRIAVSILRLRLMAASKGAR